MLNQFDKTVVFTICPDQWLGYETHDSAKMTVADFEHVLQLLMNAQKANSTSLLVVFDQASHLSLQSKQMQFLTYNSRHWNTAILCVEQLPEAVPYVIRWQADIVMSGRFDCAKTGGKIYHQFPLFKSFSDFQAAQPGKHEFIVGHVETVEYYTPGAELHGRL